MRKVKNILVSAIVVLILMSCSLNAYADADNLNGNNLILEKNNVLIRSGQVVDLSDEITAESILGLTEGTIIIEYKSNSSNQYQSLLSVSNTTNGNQDRHFHLYITSSGMLGMELRNTDSEFKYTMSVKNAVDPGKTNIVALKGDSVAKNYKLFANGELVGILNKEYFKFFSDITGLNNISLGGTVRQGIIAYPFGGTIYNARIFNSVLTDQELLSMTNNTPKIPSGIIMEENNVPITSGKVYDLSDTTGADIVQALSKGTVVLSYTSTSNTNYQSLFSAGNSKVGNQDRHFHIYITNTGALGMELRNTDRVFKYTLDRPAVLRGKYKSEYAMNTVAFKADKENRQYKLFANGELVAKLDVEDFKFINDITGVDNVALGGTIRSGVVKYPFEGTIHNIKVYGDILSDEELLTATAATTYGTNIFYSGDATNSNYFRIPTLLTLSSGTVVSSIDARYGGTHDAKSKINIAFSRSLDGGLTWETPSLPMKFDDYAAQRIEWPRDSKGKNIQIQGSASFIDSVLLEDTDTGRLFLFADAMPAGIGFSNTAAGSGFKVVNGNKYIKLRWYKDKTDQYNYSIRENGIIYSDIRNMPTEYSVDKDYNLLRNGSYLTQKQYLVHFEGTNLIEEQTDTNVKMNVFYKDSLFKVLPTNFLVMKYSDDEGQTWSELKVLSSFKAENERVPLFGPGVGKQIKKGKYEGRLIVSVYSSITGEFGFLYSDDHGETWNFITTDLGDSGSFAEAQIVEMPDGSLKTYMRTNESKIAVITSLDGGQTWSEKEFVPGMEVAPYGTQISVINYSQPVDGKPAILLSAPNATKGRRDGKIRIGLIEDTGKSGYGRYVVNWKYCFSVDLPDYGYSYSCLTELPDKRIGVYYEKYDSWSRNELHLKNIMKFEAYSINELKTIQ